MTPTHLSIGAHAPDYTFSAMDGTPRALSSLWADGPTLLVFLRHFGCIFCREQLKSLETHHAEIGRAGLQPVAVALGRPEHARRYCAQLSPSLSDCLSSTETDGYHLWGMKQGSVGQLMNPQTVIAGARAFSHGVMQGATTGDPLIIGGTFIVDRAGIIRYAYYSKFAGDHPSFDSILNAAAPLALRAAPSPIAQSGD